MCDFVFIQLNVLICSNQIGFSPRNVLQMHCFTISVAHSAWNVDENWAKAEIEMWNINIAIVKRPLNCERISSKRQNHIIKMDLATKRPESNEYKYFRSLFVHHTDGITDSILFNQKKRKSTIRFWYQVLEYLVATICETYYESSHKTSFIIHNIRCSISETRRNFFHSLSLAPVVIARCCLYFTGNFKYFAVKSFRHMQSSSACICERADKQWAWEKTRKIVLNFL